MAFEKDQAKAAEKAARVKLFAHDIHGVLTPNTFYCDVDGNRRFGFWHMDGFGDLSLNFNGIKVIFLDTTSIGNEGIGATPERDLLIADEPDEFAKQVVGLLRDPLRRQRIGQSGRRFVAEMFGWQGIIDQLENIYDEMVKVGSRQPQMNH